MKRIDDRARPAIDGAVCTVEKALAELGDGDRSWRALADLRDRLLVLRCWFVTNRNVAAWIADVHGYLDAKDRRTRTACRQRLRAMVASEIASTRRLLALWRTSRVRFMAVSAGVETTFLYGRSFGRHLARKIDLMSRYGDVEPRIDRDIMWRVRALSS